MATNPLVGSSWGAQPPQNNILQNSLFLPPQASPNTNPGGYGNPGGANEINRNMGLTNIQAGQEKNYLAPQFAGLMGKYAGPAGNFFQNLMNLGSPFYQQHQRQAFEQGNQQNQNAAASARQQLGSQGFGYTPSGANAAMIGGMEQQGSQNLAEQYLQNLFQNEQLQQSGAANMMGLAGMFNPTQLLGGTSVGADITRPSNFFQNFNAVTSGLGSMFGGGGQAVSAVRGGGQ